MIKRTIVIQSATYLSVNEDQLVIQKRGEDSASTIPIEDIGLLEIDTLQSTITTSAMVRLGEFGATVILTDGTHHPASIIQPLSGNTLHAERLRLQIEASEPTKKQLWKSIVHHKISNQADHLVLLGLPDATVRRRLKSIMSDDSTNQEGVAAAAYWQQVLKPFNCRRDRDGPPPNNLLNYGYAIVRACVARAIVSTGLHPAIGIKHSNRYNAFALADDVMEPFRPFVDMVAIPLALENIQACELTPDIKKALLQVLTLDAFLPNGTRPLMNAISLSASSIVQVLCGDRKKPLFPRLCE